MSKSTSTGGSGCPRLDEQASLRTLHNRCCSSRSGRGKPSVSVLPIGVGACADAFARKVNPQLALLETSGCGGYYWTIFQAEIATDVLFKDQPVSSASSRLAAGGPAGLFRRDVLRFLGRKLHGNFQGEVSTDLKKRPRGASNIA